MPCLQPAERAAVSVEAAKNPILPIMRRVLRLKSFCMSKPRSKGTDDFSCHYQLADKRMSSPRNLRSSKRHLSPSQLERLTRCLRSENEGVEKPWSLPSS